MSLPPEEHRFEDEEAGEEREPEERAQPGDGPEEDEYFDGIPIEQLHGGPPKPPRREPAGLRETLRKAASQATRPRQDPKRGAPAPSREGAAAGGGPAAQANAPRRGESGAGQGKSQRAPGGGAAPAAHPVRKVRIGDTAASTPPGGGAAKTTAPRPADNAASAARSLGARIRTLLVPPSQGKGKRPRLWVRFLIAAALIVSSTAAATSAAILIYVQNVAHALSHGGKIRDVKPFLSNVVSGGPETILVLGSDKRAGVQGQGVRWGNSDTAILVRFTPNSGITMLSIPRDLQVDIPGFGTAKFNAAYADGGPELTIQTLKELTGLQVNHVVNVDFLGFVDTVDSLGCVWAQVDQRYYHTAAENYALAPTQRYTPIDLQPGYQRLCGGVALGYVRYRHSDTDIVREARQQDFLHDARQMISLSKLIAEHTQLVNIFTKYTTSDVNDSATVLRLLKLYLESENGPVKQVHLPVVLHPKFVTASPEDIQNAADQFLTPPNSNPARPSAAAGGGGGADGGGQGGQAGQGAAGSQSSGGGPALSGLDGSGLGSLANQLGGDFPFYYPRRVPGGTTLSASRVYGLHDPSGNQHRGYVMVLKMPFSAQSDYYFDVQGIKGWSNPPMLNDASSSVTFGARKFAVYSTAGRIRMIAWHDGQNSYWIYNNLMQEIPNGQMLAMARSVGELNR